MKYDDLVAMKKEILANVKEANAEEKKITPRAIELVKEATLRLQQALESPSVADGVIRDSLLKNVPSQDITQKTKDKDLGI